MYEEDQDMSSPKIQPVDDREMIERQRTLLRIKQEPAHSLCRPRRSKRLVAHPTDNEIYSININGVKWTSMERVALLLGLKKYGLLDLKNLHKVVATKTEKEIKNCIDETWKTTRTSLTAASRKKKARAVLQGFSDGYDDPPIEKWLHIIEAVTPKQQPLYDRSLSKVFSVIAKYEDHPSPEECGGVDYREAYEYLHHMLAGIPGKSLSPPTAKFVLKSITQLGERIRSKDRSNALNFLHGLQKIPNGCKASRTYSRIKPTEQTPEVPVGEGGAMDLGDEYKSLSVFPGFNPLGVPMEYLRSDETH